MWCKDDTPNFTSGRNEIQLLIQTLIYLINDILHIRKIGFLRSPSFMNIKLKIFNQTQLMCDIKSQDNLIYTNKLSKLVHIGLILTMSLSRCTASAFCCCCRWQLHVFGFLGHKQLDVLWGLGGSINKQASWINIGVSRILFINFYEFELD